MRFIGFIGDEREKEIQTELKLYIAVNVKTKLVLSMAATRRTAAGSRETRDARYVHAAALAASRSAYHAPTSGNA